MKMKWKVVSPYTGIEEDAPASSAGGGNIAGIGVDHPDRPGSGEPGIDPKKKNNIPTRMTFRAPNRSVAIPLIGASNAPTTLASA